eukprot:TRINITY_DN20526_c0_g1_i1.p1 TRINITY_DN20526_c0_g1~~TRINITY_DN20526_c0_g1_i1.p1  ORF type:complete len:699 (-),score=139.21 TRINITY_DN20526_c0_g1_i1:29-2125(-)
MNLACSPRPPPPLVLLLAASLLLAPAAAEGGETSGGHASELLDAGTPLLVRSLLDASPSFSEGSMPSLRKIRAALDLLEGSGGAGADRHRLVEFMSQEVRRLQENTESVSAFPDLSSFTAPSPPTAAVTAPFAFGTPAVAAPAAEDEEAPAVEAPQSEEAEGGEESPAAEGEGGAGGLEEEVEAEREEEEESFSPEGVGVAFTLLGSLAFAMTLMYLVNWVDDDIRRYSWLVISMTISIFCAVLMFAGTTKWLQTMLKGVPVIDENPTLFYYLLFVCWLVGLVITVAFNAALMCGTISVKELMHQDWVVEDSLRSTHQEIVPLSNIAAMKWGLGVCMGEDGYPVFVRQRRLVREKLDRRMRCWATIIAHAAGFASIRAGTSLMHTSWFAQNVGTACVAVLVHLVVLILLFGTFDRLVQWHDKPEPLVEMYDEQIEEASNDVLSLTMSFLVVQCIKFGLTGVQGDEGGYQPAPSVPTDWHGGLSLYAIGIIFLMLAMVLISWLKDRVDTPQWQQQAKDMLQSTCTMCFSWCFLFATRWCAIALYMHGTMGLKPGSMLLNVALSVLLSAFAFLCTLILDKVEDSFAREGETQAQAKMFKSVITALGLLVGLSWEHSFDVAVEVAAEKTSRPVMMELVFTVVVVALIVPAWRRYVLTKQIYYAQLKEEMASGTFQGKEEFRPNVQGYSVLNYWGGANRQCT